MKRLPVSTASAALALVALSLGATPVLAATEFFGSLEFAPVTLGPGQGARVGVVNLPAGAGLLPPGPCRVQVNYYDSLGNALPSPAPFTLAPQQSSSVPLLPPANTLNSNADTIDTPPQVRAQVRYTPLSCALRPLLEIYDRSTGSTLFAIPVELRELNPQPEPPG